MTKDALLTAAVLSFMAISLLGVIGSFCRIVSLDAEGLTLVSLFGRRFRRWSDLSTPIERYDGRFFWILLAGPAGRRVLKFPFAWAIPLPKSARGTKLLAELAKHVEIFDIKGLSDLARSRKAQGDRH